MEKVTFYLVFDVAMAAHGPQKSEGSPKENDEESPKESNHGGSKESPPHTLAIAVTGHVCREGDDVRGRVRFYIITHYLVADSFGNVAICSR